ncbi:MAG: hypothetical protein ACKO0Z_02810 [Betaproteobacteria bacterium]
MIALVFRLPSHGAPITRVQMQCGTAGAAGGLWLVGIYSLGGVGKVGGTGEQLVSKASFDFSTTGIKVATLDQPLPANGSCMILAFYSSAAATVRAVAISRLASEIVQMDMTNNSMRHVFMIRRQSQNFQRCCQAFQIWHLPTPCLLSLLG